MPQTRSRCSQASAAKRNSVNHVISAAYESKFAEEIFAEGRKKFLFRHIQIAIHILEQGTKALVEDAANRAFDKVAVPKAPVLERSFAPKPRPRKTLIEQREWLERLQCRRKVEAVPHSLVCLALEYFRRDEVFESSEGVISEISSN